MQEAQAEAAETVSRESLIHALELALPWLEHPEVNALPLCGSPRALAEHIRTLIPEEKKAAQAFDFPMGKRLNAKSEGAEGGFIAEGSLSTDGLCRGR